MIGGRKFFGIGFFFFFIFICFPGAINAQKKWDGDAGDGVWENPLNWLDNIVPLPSEDVLLDNSILPSSFNVIITGISGTVSCRSIHISPSGSNTISLVVPPSNLQAIAFSTMGAGYSIELESGSILINASGASSGVILSITDSMKIHNNGRYIHRTQRGNATILNSLSSAAGTEKGIVEFDVPAVSGSYIVSMTNRTFGSLVLSSVTNNAPLTYISNGSNRVRIRGDLQINSQVSFSLGFDDTIRIKGNMTHDGNIFNLSNNGNPTVIQLEGNISSSAGSTITETNVAQPVLLFSGNLSQDIHVLGPVLNQVVIKLRKNGVVTLSSPLSLPHILELKKGVLKTDQTNLLTLNVSAEIIVDSTLIDSSFIDGPVRKLGFSARDHFLFPVGKGNKMRWLELKNITGDFTVEFIKANPHSLSSVMSGIDHISGIEYWTVESSGTASANVELSFDNVNSGGVTDLASLRVAQLTGTWVSRGNIATTGSAGASGSVTSNTITNFDIASRNFTLASIVPNQNPLPSKWVKLNVNRQAEKLQLHWSVSPDWKILWFIVEASYDGIHFQEMKKSVFIENTLSYNCLLMNNESNFRYYRINAKDIDGSIFSNSICVASVKSTLILWCENPVVADYLMLRVSSPKPCTLDIHIVNNLGQVVWKEKMVLLPGSQMLKLDLPFFTSGVYQLMVIEDFSNTKVLRFLKY